MDLRPALMMETASLLLRPLELFDVPFLQGQALPPGLSDGGRRLTLISCFGILAGQRSEFVE